ncbi:MAG: phytanoyl-CoA dioxygenase family protein [Elusimicrobia bacterium]|nr:phytanoyl-CoA dioxygenase family protein [Elusimicrobiota bacterium]
MAIPTIEFSKQDAKRPSAKTLRKVRSAMERDGAVAFANLFPLPLLKRLRAEVLRRHASGELHARGLVRDIAGRYAAVLPFEGPFLDPGFYADPKLRAMLAALLGEDYRISSLETVIAMPGAYRQHQHIDAPIRFDRSVGGKKIVFPGDLSALPPYAVTLCVPLCDVTEENGPTAIWRGSHRAALRARPPGEKEVARRFPVERMAGPFGRSFFFDYRTFHGGMPNLTSEPRPVLMFVFTRSWFRDPNTADVFPRLVVSRRSLARVPERHRPLFLLAPAARRALWGNKA